MNNQRIMTLTAKSLFKYFPKKIGQENKPFCFDTRKRTLYTLVVKAENDMEDCPLFYQFVEVLKADKKREKLEVKKRYSLYGQILVVDFEDIFLPLGDNPSDSTVKRKATLLYNANDIIENGFDIIFDKGATVRMRPFDKSGNMSRNARITFVNEVYVKDLNERLNLGIDFSNMKVKLSKYYAYRGLYLSTAQRVEHENFDITPETLVIVKNKRFRKNSDEYRRNDYTRDVLITTATQGENPAEWEFMEPKKSKVEPVKVPLDGVGVITEDYAKYINDSLGIKGATSFQIRLPFAKGMLHQVDVCGFIEEYSNVGKGDKQYIYEDPFGIERDLRKAKIFMTESMLKGQDWFVEHCQKHEIKDPVKFYCDMIKKYNHALYVSGTDLPYGHSKYTHLSYQTINTLALNERQFERIIEGHGKFIKNPIEYIKTCSEREEDRIENEDSAEDENSVGCEDSVVVDDSKAEEVNVSEEGIITSTSRNWENAIIKNPDFAKDKYISEQLKNTQKSLLTKVATGKILVEGQTRFLCRDLLALLSDLLREDADADACFLRFLFSRFYMPFGKGVKSSLEFDKQYAFFRNPHLSRNEQYIDIAFVMPESKDVYARDGQKEYEDYVKYIKMYDKYFGHLTGVVMVPRGSMLPLCLGGADFDGDLVSVIFNQDVVDAVKKGVYKEVYSPSLNYYKRKISEIKIPESNVEEEVVPEYVSYKHIYDTFSNYIGQISNAAISIGQNEYGRRGYVDEVIDVHQPSCAKCTLLTGLEIDAAKNGIHPNLDIILKTGIQKSGYLDFLRDFRKLKVEDKFHYETLEETMEIKEIDGVEQETGVKIIGVKNCDTVIKWDTNLEKEGTYINLIPHYFLKYLQTYKELKSLGSNKKKDKKVQEEMLFKEEKLTKEEAISIKAFQKSCDEIFKIYMFYKKFLKKLTEEKNRGYYAVENSEIHIMRMYDEEYVDKKIFETISAIREKIVAFIPEDSKIAEIRERINTEQWQYQPMERRPQVLEKIIGNGFKASDLEKEECELLYHFNQQGYKFLWRIMDLIEGPTIRTYEEMYSKHCEKVEKVAVEEFENLDNALYQDLRIYYESNTINVSQLIYAHTLSELKKVINIYLETGVANSKLVAAMYKKTRSNSDKAKFFWDAFSWDDLEGLIKDKEADEGC